MPPLQLTDLGTVIRLPITTVLGQNPAFRALKRTHHVLSLETQATVLGCRFYYALQTKDWHLLLSR